MVHGINAKIPAAAKKFLRNSYAIRNLKGVFGPKLPYITAVSRPKRIRKINWDNPKNAFEICRPKALKSPEYTCGAVCVFLTESLGFGGSRI
jgi:hypothetical protein